MHLSWRNPDGIAKALQEAYPEVDRLSLTPVTLTSLIVRLQAFDANGATPDDNALNDILWRWMRYAAEPQDGQQRVHA